MASDCEYESSTQLNIIYDCVSYVSSDCFFINEILKLLNMYTWTK